MGSDNISIRLKQLHQQLVDGNQSVTNELCKNLLKVLSVSLIKKYPHIDEDILSDCITDAVFEYITDPSRYDPSKIIKLESFLLMNAARNVQDFAKKSATYQRKKDAYSEFFQKFVANDTSESNKGLSESEFEERCDELIGVLQSTEDRNFLKAQLDGKKGLGIYAQILGLQSASAEKQRIEIKRTRDRITKALKRYVQTKNRKS